MVRYVHKQRHANLRNAQLAHGQEVLENAIGEVMTEKEIDAGAEALRQRMQGGKRLNDWDALPNSTKRKWREHAVCVLAAAEQERVHND